MKFGLTHQFECSYLKDRHEQLLVLADQEPTSPYHYDLLIGSGFRRSGEQVYRPHCPQCSACNSIRVLCDEFTPSKSQKRVRSKNKDIKVIVSREDKPEYYTLYERYINERHQDGSMFPATHHQYASFVNSSWCESLFFEFRSDDELIAVAVTDKLNNALSALYTFFEPNMAERSIGTFAILTQIEFARQCNIRHLYLGYQVDACAKMNYKTKFYPHERFISNKWHYFAKKAL